MSKREREADRTSDRIFEYDVDGLVESVGRLLEANAGGPLWRDPRFVDWLAIETREHDRRAQRRTDRELLTEGRALLAGLRARQLSVTRVTAPPRLRVPSMCGTPGDVLLPAARERAAPVVELGVAAGIGRELWDEAVDSWLEIPLTYRQVQYLALKVAGRDHGAAHAHR